MNREVVGGQPCPDGREAEALRSVVNGALNRARVPAPAVDALAFHARLPGYRPTPVHQLEQVATELGLTAVAVKDESGRLGLPAFKVLGAAWAVERALLEWPGTHTLVAASAGNHGRAVARVARQRGLRCRVYLPARSSVPRRAAIADEGAEVVVIDGSYEQAVGQAAAAGRDTGVLEIADVGGSGPARWVIDGYATLFSEASAQVGFDLVVVPVGVGSLAAAAARAAAQVGAQVVAVEPAAAACLAASLAAGRPTTVANPGTVMAGMDCAEVSEAAWPSLRDGLDGAVTVDDAETRRAMVELAGAGLRIGDCGAAPLAALRALATDPDCRPLAAAVGLGPASRVLLVATEGVTDPDSYEAALRS